MKQYTFNDAIYGTHSLIANEIGKNKLVLDVGCNKGYLKQLAPENSFYGIDLDERDLDLATKNEYQAVFKLDLNNHEHFLCDKKFDVIVFGDILEHLLFPLNVLQYFKDNFLKEKGKIIISLPNVANFSVRFALLFGHFNYTESGILDRTHFHLYTKKSAEELIRNSGLRIIKKKFSSNNFGKMIERIPALGGLLGFSLIFVCQKKY